jgi:hypothetical protein
VSTIISWVHSLSERQNRYARVDRRPLDPPPVVLLRLFYVYNAGTDRETEKEIRNYEYVSCYQCALRLEVTLMTCQ